MLTRFRKKHKKRIKLHTLRVWKRFEKRTLLRDLYEKVLKKDSHWHFFLDSDGITLRYSPKFKKKIVSFLKERSVEYDKEGVYSPEKHEYSQLKFIGQDWLPLFHELSVISCRYPPNVLRGQVLERLTHVLVNQSGMHDFKKEARLYAKLGLDRSWLDGFYLK